VHCGWQIEEAIQTAKGDAGLDHDEVRRYDACTGM
jgi:hypothetical protein